MERTDSKDLNIDKNSGSISKVFKELTGKKRKAFIPFITCGYPDMDGFMQTYELLDSSGSDIIEIGIPFSDPLADGPVIQKTSNIALKKGINTDTVFEAVRDIRKKSITPIALLVYFNMIYKYGIERFINNAAGAGANGIIIPDLPMEEYKSYNRYFAGSGIENIMIVSLTSDDHRLKEIIKVAEGFIYCVSLKGVTGARSGLSTELEDFLNRLRSFTDLPLAVGFGISTPEQVNTIKDKCDGIIIGSKILDILLKEDDLVKGLKKLEEFIGKIKKSLET